MMNLHRNAFAFIAILATLCLSVSSVQGKTEEVHPSHPTLLGDLLPHYYGASYLLPHLRGDERKAFARVSDELTQLTQELHKEETKLASLKEIRKSTRRQEGWLWFFNTQSRLRVEKAELDVRDQRRAVENLYDDIQFIWKEIKPHYGVFSKMFLDEVLSIIPMIGLAILQTFEAIMAVGVISILVGGPAFLLLAVSFMRIFGTTGPIFIFGPMFGMILYWMITLPGMIIQYDPQLWEFFAVYFPLLGVLGFCAGLCLRGLTPVQLPLGEPMPGDETAAVPPGEMRPPLGGRRVPVKRD
jgi:hypothetical protein